MRLDEEIDKTEALLSLLQGIYSRFKSWNKRQSHPTSSSPCGIVYCHRRTTCEQISALISEKLTIKTAAYHAGLDQLSRQQRLHDWLCGDVSIIVATIAFGMGVDKSDVRFVFHFDLSKSFEGKFMSVYSHWNLRLAHPFLRNLAYYQESGRAGRDRKTSRCIVLYKETEVVARSSLLALEKSGISNGPQSEVNQRAAMNSFHAVRTNTTPLSSLIRSKVCQVSLGYNQLSTCTTHSLP